MSNFRSERLMATPRLGMSYLLRGLKSALLEDWTLKIICLALALLMWFYIDGELTGQSTFTVSMRSSDIQLQPGWSLAPSSPLPEFLVTVRGPRRSLPM